MPRWSDDDDREEGFDTDEGADEESTIPCPYCRELIHEDSPQCPQCGNYLSEEDATPRMKPWWLIIGVLVCLALVYFWIRGQ